MAIRRRKLIGQVVAKPAPNLALTLTIPVLKPRNRVAMNPLLKKSAVHTGAQSRDRRGCGDALEVPQGVQDALNRRRGSRDKGFDDGGNNG